MVPLWLIKLFWDHHLMATRMGGLPLDLLMVHKYTLFYFSFILYFLHSIYLCTYKTCNSPGSVKNQDRITAFSAVGSLFQWFDNSSLMQKEVIKLRWKSWGLVVWCWLAVRVERQKWGERRQIEFQMSSFSALV